MNNDDKFHTLRFNADGSFHFYQLSRAMVNDRVDAGSVIKALRSDTIERINRRFRTQFTLGAVVASSPDPQEKGFNWNVLATEMLSYEHSSFDYYGDVIILSRHP